MGFGTDQELKQEMWGSSTKSKSAKVETLIGENTEFVGNVHFKGGLHLDGLIKGNVVADDGSSSVAIVSERGCIEGEVRVPRLLLNGKVVGDVYATERVELHRHARVTGNVYYNMLEMAMGAEINGNLVHRKPNENKLLEDKSAESKHAKAAESAAADNSGNPEPQES
ncbi:MAG: polymer-forming cytoskeletal protein [Pseudomonadota bacterium]